MLMLTSLTLRGGESSGQARDMVRIEARRAELGKERERSLVQAERRSSGRSLQLDHAEDCPSLDSPKAPHSDDALHSHIAQIVRAT